MTELPYTITKGITGVKVNYKCPNCKVGLSNPLKEAGILDVCPDCGCQYQVPGVNDLKHAKAQQAAAEQRKKQERIQKRSDKAQAKVEREKQAERMRAARVQSKYTPPPVVASKPQVDPNNLAPHPVLVLFLPAVLCWSCFGRQNNKYPNFALCVGVLTGLMCVCSVITTMVQYLMLILILVGGASNNEIAGETTAVALGFQCGFIILHILTVAFYMALIEMAWMLADIEKNTRS